MLSSSSSLDRPAFSHPRQITQEAFLPCSASLSFSTHQQTKPCVAFSLFEIAGAWFPSGVSWQPLKVLSFFWTGAFPLPNGLVCKASPAHPGGSALGCGNAVHL